MSRINVRLPEPKEDYEVTTQRQINRAGRTIEYNVSTGIKR